MNDKLSIFLLVVKNMNFSRTAEELFMTQPAVSQYVKNLEEELGVQLFDRSHKQIQLTKAGEIVAYYGKEIDTLSQSMKRKLDDLTSHVGGDLLLGASYSYGEYLLPKRLAAFLDVYPQVVPSICIANTAEIAEKIVDQTLDLGIIEGTVNNKWIESHKIATDHLVVVAKSGQLVHNLDTHTWIIREEGSGTREAFDNFKKEHKLNPTHTMVFGSTQLIKEAVANGLGLALLSEWTIQDEIHLNKLQIIRREDFHYQRDFHAIHLNTPFLTKTTDTFLEYLKRNK
ncbi:LysR family transcriptional regulator [Rummeliibacillus stabekisii]|uniref:LysR family transcriptional regulator n=1 Tax=Rummeliibacillus stabekisii TaxID=241244 RepID=UPI00203A5818|nr:LysR family transcriptional regulator [Rummeliibacillus stabekisii]MCM3317811.1 LysR family transcriptional regulator [Rummeliibacillus stabekisii]